MAKIKFLIKLFSVVILITTGVFISSVAIEYMNNISDCNEYIAITDLATARSVNHYRINGMIEVNGAEIVPLKKLTDDELGKQLKIHKAIYSDSFVDKIKLKYTKGYIGVRRVDLPEGHPKKVKRLTLSQAIKQALKK